MCVCVSELAIAVLHLTKLSNVRIKILAFTFKMSVQFQNYAVASTAVCRLPPSLPPSLPVL